MRRLHVPSHLAPSTAFRQQREDAYVDALIALVAESGPEAADRARRYLGGPEYAERRRKRGDRPGTAGLRWEEDD